MMIEPRYPLPPYGILSEEYSGRLRTRPVVPPDWEMKDGCDTACRLAEWNRFKEHILELISPIQSGIPAVDGLSSEIWRVKRTRAKFRTLNQAETETGLFARQCLGTRRGPHLKTLRREGRAWNRRTRPIKINWKFDRTAARRKFGYKKNSFKRSRTRPIIAATTQGFS